MKKVLLTIVLVSALVSCKSEKKEVENVIPEVEVVQPEVEEPEMPKLPANVVQLNDTVYEGDGLNLVKAQIQNTEGNKFLIKVFLGSENIDLYKNGDYSLFIQNFAYEGDVEKLDKRFQKAGVASYWVNLKSIKDYDEEHVLFKAFDSELLGFKKTVIGVMNVKTKTDVFRVQYDDTILVN
ncbi:hypothetical protein Q4512_03050 [Oceanihabitans sp. 2_MG-2023]|uniref:hypothetical protein n=1 Tax=Oceanihabitans sp. 2_MG-2023 TaxID=3062661 RepID=UPI0026E214F3|nr:hypothetical protein [Oceanihabitans sp. 2_MG-2023]MDO6595875.1 hypothetical protein [Oceanihabitans sp. 2_MG-2023]